MRLIPSVFRAVFAIIDLKNTTMRIQAGGSGEWVELKIGEGNMSWDEQKTREYILNRGNLDEVRDGDDVPMEVSFDIQWEYLSGGTATNAVATPVDALKRRGPAAAWTSADTEDTCRPYAVDIILYNVPTPSSCGDKETITLPDFRYERLSYDLRNGTIAASGKCNVEEATIVREAQT